MPKLTSTTMDPTDGIIAKFLERFITWRTGKSFRFDPMVFVYTREIVTADLERMPEPTSFVKDVKSVTESLQRIADNSRELISEKYNGHLAHLAEYLLPMLMEIPKNLAGMTYEEYEKATSQFEEEFEEVTFTTFFSEGISWSRIVAFLLFNAILASKAIESDKSSHSSMLVHHLFECVSNWFTKDITAWIGRLQGGWFDLVRYEKEDFGKSYLTINSYGDVFQVERRRNNSPKRTVKHYFGAAAIVAVVAGLVLRSKLSVQ